MEWDGGSKMLSRIQIPKFLVRINFWSSGSLWVGFKKNTSSVEVLGNIVMV